MIKLYSDKLSNNFYSISRVFLLNINKLEKLILNLKGVMSYRKHKLKLYFILIIVYQFTIFLIICKKRIKRKILLSYLLNYYVIQILRNTYYITVN